MNYLTRNLRNVAVCGHTSTGKTTLVEQMLFSAGVLQKAETVDSGRTVSDFSKEEIESKLSMHASLVHFDWGETKINVFDTPGLADFAGEVVSSLRASESGLMVIDCTESIQVETIKIWRRLNKRKMPRMIFLNKMDGERANFEVVLKDLEKLGMTLIPLTLPMGSSSDYKGVINLMTMEAVTPSPKGEMTAPIPEELSAWANEYHDKMIEAAAEGDDQLMETYFSGNTLSLQEAFKGLREGLADNKFVPIFCGSAIQNSGLRPLLDFIAKDSPSPERILEPCIATEKPQMISPEGQLSGIVFKTSIDRFAGKMSFIKVITGVLHPGTEILTPQEKRKERVSKIFFCQGKQLSETGELAAGDLGIITKIDSLRTSDTFCASEMDRHYLPLQLPHPVHSLAIKKVSQKDEEKLSEQLHRIAEEDLTFAVRYNPETRQTVISGMGELHVRVVLNRIRNEFHIPLETEPRKIPYRETITREASSEYTHKKQTGGHGQYGRVAIRVSPKNPGEGFEFVNNIKGGVISKGYIPGVEKGLKEAMQEGYLASFPMMDVGVELFDGKEHSVDSSEMAFKLAAKQALKNAFQDAGVTLLEPISLLRIYVDEALLGDVLSDLSSKRAIVQNQASMGAGIQEIKALVPQGEILNYAVDLRSITSGTGTFEMKFSHYQPVSGKTAQSIIESVKAS